MSSVLNDKKRKKEDEKVDNIEGVKDSKGAERRKKNKKMKKKHVVEKPQGLVVCPLCESTGSASEPQESDKVREYMLIYNKYYYACGECTLVFVHPNFHSSNEKEKERYEYHSNSPTDAKYMEFLKPAVKMLEPYLEGRDKESLRGLDFGCGPCPTLSVMFKETGYTMEDYDPYFKENPNVRDNNRIYDYITCTEAIEHFKSPREELFRIFRHLLKEDGVALIMTQLLQNDEMFSTWFYPRDHTHICFFRKTTFEWISKSLLHIDCTIHEKENIMIFKQHPPLTPSLESTTTLTPTHPQTDAK